MVGTRCKEGYKDPQVGGILKEARRRQCLSVGQVSAALRIPAEQVQALEEGDFSIFAAEVYARGAYVSYTQHLGIKSRQADRALSRALGAVRQRVPLRVHRPARWLAQLVTPRLILAAAGTLVAFVVGGYITWQVQSYFVLPALEVVQPDSSIAGASAVVVRGRAEHDARVSINGEMMLLQPDGSFQSVIHMHPGINIVRVEAENAAGRKHIVQRDILLPRETARIVGR